MTISEKTDEKYDVLGNKWSTIYDVLGDNWLTIWCSGR